MASRGILDDLTDAIDGIAGGALGSSVAREQAQREEFMRMLQQNHRDEYRYMQQQAWQRFNKPQEEKLDSPKKLAEVCGEHDEAGKAKFRQLIKEREDIAKNVRYCRTQVHIAPDAMKVLVGIQFKNGQSVVCEETEFLTSGHHAKLAILYDIG